MTRLLPTERAHVRDEWNFEGIRLRNAIEESLAASGRVGLGTCSGVEIVKERRVEERDPNGWSRQPVIESFILPYNYHDVKGIPGEKGYWVCPRVTSKRI